MKKTLIAVAALAATGAFAQATVYGRLDIGYAQNTTQNTLGNVLEDVKSSGIAGQGLVTNYWGLKGSEDLAGGMKANFQLEEGLDTTSGAATAGFTRISTVGLSGNFGSVNLGRFYTPFFQAAGAQDVFGTTGASTVSAYSMKGVLTALNNAGGLTNAQAGEYQDTVRNSNAIFYTSPNMSGVEVKVMLAPNSSTTNNAAGTVSTETKTSNTSASVSYSAGPLMVVAGMITMQTDTNRITAPATSATTKTDAKALSVTYDLRVVKIYAGMINNQITLSTAGNPQIDSKEVNIGLTAPMGAATLMAQVGTNKVDISGATSSATGTDMVLGVTYDLSKRTAVYLKTGTYDKFAVDGGGEYKTTTTAFGLKTAF